MAQLLKTLSSPIRQRAEARVRRALTAEFDELDTTPIQAVPVDPDLYPAVYRAAPDLSPAQQIETTIERYRVEHGGAPPTAVYLDETTLLDFLRTIAPELFLFRAAIGGHVVELRPAPEMTRRMMMCFRLAGDTRGKRYRREAANGHR